MSARSSIEWCDSTFNPWIGCTRVSPACDHCYAAASTPARTLGIAWGTGEPRRRTSPATWRLPIRWNAKPFYECTSCGWRGENPFLGMFCPRDGRGKGCGSDPIRRARRRVFCASLADVFDNEVPASWRADLFSLIRATPNLDWLLLTKRIGNAARMMDEAGGWAGAAVGADPRTPMPNVWLGATICTQDEANRDIPKLLAVPAAVHFLSMEPLLAEVDLAYPESLFPNGPAMCCSGYECGCAGRPIDPPLFYGLDWVIVGGESGHGARPMHPDWVRILRDQCAAYRVPFLFKQWGCWAPSETWPDDVVIPSGTTYYLSGANDDRHAMWNVSKKAAGRTLDGVLHNGFPVASP